MTDDFSKYPESLTERKAMENLDAKFWTPRDVLISLLREIDSGETKVDIMFIALGTYVPGAKDTDDTKTGYRAAGKNHYELSGLAHRAIWMMQND